MVGCVASWGAACEAFPLPPRWPLASACSCPYCGLGAVAEGGPSAGAGELPLHRVHLREVAAGGVVAALLAGGQAEAPPGIGVARSGSAQVDDGGQILLSRERRRGDPQPGDRIGDVPIQQGGR